jgi:hypothetical protein
MATDNVTAIDAAKPPRPSSAQPIRGPKRNSKMVSLGGLTDEGTFQGFTTHDLISALHGVCVVLDNALVDQVEFERHDHTMASLAQAAKVLSSILNKEVHS